MEPHESFIILILLLLLLAVLLVHQRSFTRPAYATTAMLAAGWGYPLRRRVSVFWQLCSCEGCLFAKSAFYKYCKTLAIAGGRVVINVKRIALVLKLLLAKLFMQMLQQFILKIMKRQISFFYKIILAEK